MKTISERFWEKVDKNGPIPQHKQELGNCWIWTGAKRRHGHGYFWKEGRKVNPHRHSYEIHIGPIPDGLWVLHKCDNGACVNPSHLFVGNQKDNMSDASEKGRTYRGSRVRNSVLDEAKAAEIYQLYHLNGLTIGQLAKMFSVPVGRISKVKNGTAWAHATKHFDFPRRRGFCGPSVTG